MTTFNQSHSEQPLDLSKKDSSTLKFIPTPKDSNLPSRIIVSPYGPTCKEEEAYVATPQPPPLNSLPLQPAPATVPEDVEELPLVIDEETADTLDVKQALIPAEPSRKVFFNLFLCINLI